MSHSKRNEPGMNDSPIELWYAMWIAFSTIPIYLALIFVLQSQWIEKHRKLNILIARLCTLDFYVMWLVAIYYIVTKPNPGFATDYAAWRRRANMDYLMLSLIITLGILTLLITRKSRCPKCGQRSLHVILPPAGKYSDLCSKCDYSVISWKYYQDRKKLQRKIRG
ncbi:hypothetical protein GC170_18105 [bacterium]|nr:hypothetical protein [bacterium]